MEEKIVWSSAAAADIKNIYEYISKDSLFYAARLLDEIDLKISSLPGQPYIGRIVPEKENDQIREILFGNYRIMYSIQKLPVIVIYRIIHTAQNFK